MPPQKRWPLVKTSVSGIPPEMWAKFKEEAERHGLTLRLAVEQAVREFADKLKGYENQSMKNSVDNNVSFQPFDLTGFFRFHTTTAETRGIQMHHEVQDILRGIVKTTGYKQNVVLLNAMMWWIKGDHRQPL